MSLYSLWKLGFHHMWMSSDGQEGLGHEWQMHRLGFTSAHSVQAL